MNKETCPYEVRELQLFLENTSTYYERYLVPIAKAFQRRIAKGTFDASKAPRAYYRACLEASKGYEKESGFKFSKAVREAVAQNLATEYYEEIIAQDGVMFSQTD